MAQYNTLCIVGMLLLMSATRALRPHPKLTAPAQAAEARDVSALSRLKGEYRKVGCTDALSRERADIIERSKCGEPKEVFVHLDPKYAHEEVSPGAVWVKRCVGLCEFERGGACVPTRLAVREVPIRIYNAKTNKETCATFPVEEHLSCGCCAAGSGSGAGSGGGCAPPLVFDSRKCSCRCPRAEDRRHCLRKRNQNMRWNRSKCTCEPRRRLHS